MRLINVDSLAFEEFVGDDIPCYAILSHTWGKEEIGFQEWSEQPTNTKAGYRKISTACGLARAAGWSYIWVDTNCIDKSSSAELSEAINSMFKWYRSAEICIAYLEDVDGLHGSPSQVAEQLRQARWFTRGWTLQELIAPLKVVFYDRKWVPLGTRGELAEAISTVTGIDCTVLANLDPEARPWERFAVAQRMAWLAPRSTTRIEDIAYCMLGIFNIQMPLLYGEGDRAFVRLQEEIIKLSDDQTLFAWTAKAEDQDSEASLRYGIPAVSVLATTAKAFQGCNKVRIMPSSSLIPYSLTNVGLHMTLPVLRLWGQVDCIAVLRAYDRENVLGIVVFWHISSGRYVRRYQPISPVILSPKFEVTGFRPMYLDRTVMAVTTRTRRALSNQTGTNSTRQNLFGLLITFGESGGHFSGSAFAAQDLQTWPADHFDLASSVLRFPADSAYWQSVSNTNSTARVGGVLVRIIPHGEEPFSILFRLTITTTHHPENESLYFGWSHADDLFNTTMNRGLFGEQLQQLGMSDLDLGYIYLPRTTQVSISQFGNDFPPYSAVRHAHIYLSPTHPPLASNSEI